VGHHRFKKEVNCNGSYMPNEDIILKKEV